VGSMCQECGSHIAFKVEREEAHARDGRTQFGSSSCRDEAWSLLRISEGQLSRRRSLLRAMAYVTVDL
jgi:hypothetical protein